MVDLTVVRTDGAVILPKTSSKFIVVADLSTVRTDVVLGELTATVGGINLRYDKGYLSLVTFGQSPDLPISVSSPSSMGGQEHIPELKHTPVESETKPEVITNMENLPAFYRSRNSQLKEWLLLMTQSKMMLLRHCLPRR